MSDDPRCCGTGTCIINAQGECWCGQKWDGEKMCFHQSPQQALNENSEHLQSSDKAMKNQG